VSVWYAYQDGALLCVSHRKSALIRLLEQDPRVGFEISPNDPPYHGVRGQGTVSLAPLGEHNVLEALLDRYLGQQISPNDPPYHGVRGQGTVSLAPLGEHNVLEALLDRYLGQQESRVGNWLLARKDEETLITVQPERLFSWDYRQRMADVSAGRAPQ